MLHVIAYLMRTDYFEFYSVGKKFYNKKGAEHRNWKEKFRNVKYMYNL